MANINPFNFGPFLQVPSLPNTHAPGFAGVLSMLNDGRDFHERKREFDAQDSRANRALALQEQYQKRKFSKEDQAEVESLIGEYQAAEDQGDAVSLSRAAQRLKRFGFDVGTSGGPARLEQHAAPSPQQGPATPLPGQLLPEPLKPQSQFEEELISQTGNTPEGGYESGGETTPAFKAMLQQQLPGGEPVDMGDVDSPEFQQQASAEAQPVNLGDVDSPEFQSAAATEPGPAEQTVPGLITQPLGTRISKGGKMLYESPGGAGGRGAPIVSSVFEQFAQNADPEAASIAREAQQYAARLMGVDGMTQPAAIKAAMDHMEKQLAGLTALRRTEIGSKARRGAGGGIGDMLTGKEAGTLADDSDKLVAMITSKPEYQKVQVMDGILIGAEEALQSGDPVRQQSAISDIMRARSGLTVRKDEEASLQNAAGLWEGIKARLSQQAGYGLTDDYRIALANAITAQRNINRRIQERIARETREYYETTRTREGETGARAQQVKRNAGAIDKILRRGDGGSSGGDDYGGL